MGFGFLGSLIGGLLGYGGIKFIQWMTKKDCYWRLTYLASTSYAVEYSDNIAPIKQTEWTRPYGFGRDLRM
jgi:hypothetical protein